MKITVSFLDKEKNEKEIEVTVDISVYFDGIGPYEYWGQKGYDKGDICVDINEIAYDKSGLTKKEIKQIENYFKSEEFHGEILQKHVDNQQALADDAAEAAYESRMENFNY